MLPHFGWMFSFRTINYIHFHSIIVACALNVHFRCIDTFTYILISICVVFCVLCVLLWFLCLPLVTSIFYSEFSIHGRALGIPKCNWSNVSNSVERFAFWFAYKTFFVINNKCDCIIQNRETKIFVYDYGNGFLRYYWPKFENEKPLKCWKFPMLFVSCCCRCWTLRFVLVSPKSWIFIKCYWNFHPPLCSAWNDINVLPFSIAFHNINSYIICLAIIWWMLLDHKLDFEYGILCDANGNNDAAHVWKWIEVVFVLEFTSARENTHLIWRPIFCAVSYNFSPFNNLCKYRKIFRELVKVLKKLQTNDKHFYRMTPLIASEIICNAMPCHTMEMARFYSKITFKPWFKRKNHIVIPRWRTKAKEERKSQ